LSKIHTNPDHLRRSGSNLSRFGQTVSAAGEQLDTAGQNLVEHAKGDRSGIGSVVANAMGRGVEITGKVFKEGGRVADKAGQNLGKTGDLHEEADIAGRDGLLKVHPDAKSRKLPGGGTRSASDVSGGGGSGGKNVKNVAGGGARSGSDVGGGSGGHDKTPPKTGGGGGGNGPHNPPPPGGGGGGGGNPPHIPGRGGKDDDGPFSKPLDSQTKKLEQIDESRVDRDKNGLITHVDKKPVKQYTTEIAQGRAQQFHDAQKAEVERTRHIDDENARRKAEYQAQRDEYKRQVDELKAQGRQREIGSLDKPRPPERLDNTPDISSNSIGQVTAVSVDRRTGAVWEGANGVNEDLADPLHPALQGRYDHVEDLRADPANNMHPDHPLGHAEVKAVNASLWERQRLYDEGKMDHPPTEADLPEMRVDNYFPFGPEVKQAPCCANCNVTLEGVPSNAGRLTAFPGEKGEFIPE